MILIFKSPQTTMIKDKELSPRRSPEFSPPPHAKKSRTLFSLTEETQRTFENYDAQRKRFERASESEQQREERLASDQQRKRAAREYEDENERRERLTTDRRQKRTVRENENENNRKARLADQRRRSMINRKRKRPSIRLESRERISKASRSTASHQSTCKLTDITNTRREQRTFEKEQQALLNQYVWPAAIPTQLKEHCLQAFCNKMSMTTLRQSVCIICGTFSYAHAMKECSLKDIPNFGNLCCPKELLEIISNAQKMTQGKHIHCIMSIRCCKFI